MKPLIDLTTFMDDINNRFINKELNFNKEEIDFIFSNPSLSSKLYELLADYDNWQNISTELYKALSDQIFQLSESQLENLTKYSIDHGEINAILESSYLSDDTTNIIKNYIIMKLQDRNYNPKIPTVGKETIRLLIENNRMDLFKTLKNVFDIFPEDVLVIREYYLNNNEKIPKGFGEFIKELQIPLSRYNLAAILTYLGTDGVIIDEENFNILLDKINSDDLIANFIDWQTIISKLSDNQKSILCDALLKRGYYDSLLHFLNPNEVDLEKFIMGYIASIKANDIIEQDIYPIKVSGTYLSILDNELVLKTLIEKRKFLTASHSKYFPQYVKEVEDYINNNKDEFINFEINNFNNIEKYPNIILALFKAGNLKVMKYVDKLPEIKEIVINEILQGNHKDIPAFLMNDDDFVNQMIVNGHIDVIFLRRNNMNRNEKFNFSDESCTHIINAATKNPIFAMIFLNRNLFTVMDNARLLNFYLRANNQAIELIINKYNHLEEHMVNYSEEMFLLVKDYLVDKYKLHKEHLNIFEKHFGPLLIRYIDNKSIQSIINMPDAEFHKFIALFPKLEFTMVDVEKIYDSLKQLEFSKIHQDDIEIFARINHMLVDNNPDYLVELDKIIEVLSSDEERKRFLRKFSSTYPNLLILLESGFDVFFKNIINYIKNGTVEEKNYYINVLHFITDYYIAYKREKYRDTYDIHRTLNLPYDLDEKDKVKQFIKNCAVRIHKNLIVLKMSDRNIDESLANDCVLYYGYNKRDFSDERIKEIQRHLKILIEITNEILKVTGISEIIVDTLDEEEKIKRNYYVETDNSNIFSILCELDVNNLLNNILNKDNENIYHSLLKHIYKYKLHLLPNYFKDLMASENININLEVSDIASFISFYAQIYNAEFKRLSSQGKDTGELNLSFVGIIKYAEAYSSVSSIYNQILGVDDARLIKSNPKPNAAVNKTERDMRLKTAVEWTLRNFQRTTVTIPTFNEIIEVGDKKIRAVVGNFTNAVNLTMGERTGSCMRIGGVGESLFTFILEDKNGFHIRFDDPVTGEFISRVSGFRNGNTVFLNELRYSCKPEEFSNKDVVDACTMVAKILVDKSVDSECPIDNVVLHNAYATEGLNLNEEYLDIADNREGLRNFYVDIKAKGIVLATTKEPFAKVNFDKSNLPVYNAAREVSFESADTNKLRILINRVHAIKYALGGLSYEYIAPIDFEKGIYYGIASQDFYIYIDNEGNIHEEIINIDHRAFIELEEARKTIWDIKLKGQYLDEVGLASFKI